MAHSSQFNLMRTFLIGNCLTSSSLSLAHLPTPSPSFILMIVISTQNIIWEFLSLYMFEKFFTPLVSLILQFPSLVASFFHLTYDRNNHARLYIFSRYLRLNVKSMPASQLPIILWRSISISAHHTILTQVKSIQFLALSFLWNCHTILLCRWMPHFSTFFHFRLPMIVITTQGFISSPQCQVNALISRSLHLLGNCHTVLFSDDRSPSFFPQLFSFYALLKSSQYLIFRSLIFSELILLSHLCRTQVKSIPSFLAHSELPYNFTLYRLMPRSSPLCRTQVKSITPFLALSSSPEL